MRNRFNFPVPPTFRSVPALRGAAVNHRANNALLTRKEIVFHQTFPLGGRGVGTAASLWRLERVSLSDTERSKKRTPFRLQLRCE